MTPKQIKLARGLMSKMGATDSKEDIVLTYSNGRTTHLSELNYSESNQLINFLMKEANISKTAKEKQIRKILYLCHEMHWELDGGKIDMARINNFCRTRTKQKKDLDKFTDNELPSLVTVFEKVYNDFLKGV